ncbi:MAG: hypothetical protein QOI83_1760 [Streptomycetaceae bacterium]|nr:hypothetical protein [Streptomycetaceae bacterium]
MAHTKSTKNTKHSKNTHRTGRRRSLRREVPSTVALVTDPQGFAAMRGYRSFTFDNHTQYLQQMEALLRSLASQGIHVSVALFDAEEYTDYCTETGQNPDTPTSRTRYTAEVASGGPTIPYTGQPLEHLITQLEFKTDRQSTWEYATSLLSRTGGCADCGQDIARSSFDRASHALRRLIEAAGPGSHHIVCSVLADSAPLLAALHALCDEDAMVHLDEAEALIFCTVLAVGIATDSSGGVVMRTSTPDGGTDQVRGWSLHDGWLHPLTEAEVFNAYCTDAETGEPVPPEPGVVHCPGTPLPLPTDD